MKDYNRIFIRGILNHCYQRTIQGQLIFYCISDYLVFFTEFCCAAREWYGHIRILSLCLMPDHIHLSVVATNRNALSGFVQKYASSFARKHNATCHRKGPLFQSPFGSAPKKGDKKARTNLVYIGNNPVERRLCTRAEAYRWNFLAYAISNHPFSEPLVQRDCSWHLKNAIREVRMEHTRRKPLSYRQLQRMFAPLDKCEREQLTDFIISTYNVIDFASAIRFFDSYDDMLTTMHANTGSEYDLNEVFTGKNDACYASMISIALKEPGIEDIHDILALPPEGKRRLLLRLRGLTDATPGQLAAFLHLNP